MALIHEALIHEAKATPAAYNLTLAELEQLTAYARTQDAPDNAELRVRTRFSASDTSPVKEAKFIWQEGPHPVRPLG